MAYGDLLRALSEEAERDARGIREGAARDAERLIEESGRVAADERERALAAAARDEGKALARARLGAAREVESAVLAESRRLLDGVRSAALDDLRRRSAALLPRFADELAALAGPGPCTFVVDAEDEQRLREHLASRHPELLARAAVRVAPVARGGLELEQDGMVLDDTLAARLDRAWPAVEIALAKLLLGGADGAV